MAFAPFQPWSCLSSVPSRFCGATCRAVGRTVNAAVGASRFGKWRHGDSGCPDDSKNDNGNGSASAVISKPGNDGINECADELLAIAVSLSNAEFATAGNGTSNDGTANSGISASAQSDGCHGGRGPVAPTTCSYSSLANFLPPTSGAYYRRGGTPPWQGSGNIYYVNTGGCTITTVKASAIAITNIITIIPQSL